MNEFFHYQVCLVNMDEYWHCLLFAFLLTSTNLLIFNHLELTLSQQRIIHISITDTVENNMGTNHRVSKVNELNSLTLNEKVKDKKQRAFKGASLIHEVRNFRK